jgi:hypothetical protein
MQEIESFWSQRGFMDVRREKPGAVSGQVLLKNSY